MLATQKGSTFVPCNRCLGYETIECRALLLSLMFVSEDIRRVALLITFTICPSIHERTGKELHCCSEANIQYRSKKLSQQRGATRNFVLETTLLERSR